MQASTRRVGSGSKGRMPRICLQLISLALPLTAVNAGEPSSEPYRVSAQVLEGEPRGPYATGTFESLWVDSGRKDPSTADPNDSRKLMVQVWYPAAVSARPRRAPYALHPQLYAKNHWVRKLPPVETLSALDAALASAPQRFPVILYSHGREFPHFSGTFQTEYLASQGYLVVAIGHTGVNGLQRFVDGTSYVEDGQRYSTQYTAATALSTEEQKLAPREQFELIWARADLGLYLQDVSFVLDRLAAFDRDPRNRLHDRLDLNHVGMVGWSLGGIIAFQATRSEPRIQAAVNLDGWPFGWMGENGIISRGSERPLLLMNGRPGSQNAPEVDVEAEDQELFAAAQTYYWTLLRRSTQDWYRVGIRGASHMNFSDVSLFEEQSPEAIHPRQAHRIINEYTLEFLDRYLRGRGQTPLLAATERYPEVELMRKSKAGEDTTANR